MQLKQLRLLAKRPNCLEGLGPVACPFLIDRNFLPCLLKGSRSQEPDWRSLNLRQQRPWRQNCNGIGPCCRRLRADRRSQQQSLRPEPCQFGETCFERRNRWTDVPAAG